MSSKEETLKVTNIQQAYNAIKCQVETRGYYSQFIDSFSIQISLTTSATVATSKLFCIHQVELCGSCIHPSSFNTNNFSLDLSLKTSTEISRLFFITKYLIHNYSVIHNSIAPSKGLCSKMALGEVGMSLP